MEVAKFLSGRKKIKNNSPLIGVTQSGARMQRWSSVGVLVPSISIINHSIIFASASEIYRSNFEKQLYLLSTILREGV